MAITHNLGFPRIGKHRELKTALESYWQGQSSADALYETGRMLRHRHWAQQQQLYWVPIGDFSFYDHVLDMSVTLGNLPERVRGYRGDALDNYFRVARGQSQPHAKHEECCAGVAAGEMTKWFDTNYHYIVPELSADTRFSLNAERLVNELEEALQQGIQAKPVIIGPLTYLALGKAKDGSDKLALLDALLPVYVELLQRLAEAGARWVQIDEPILTTELSDDWRNAFRTSYEALVAAPTQLLLTTYFGRLGGNLDLATALPVHGLHVDAVAAGDELSAILERWPQDRVLSLGVVNGRNIWKSDLNSLLDTLEPIAANLGERLWIAPSCSLLHVPTDLELETELDAEIRSWLAFATQRLEEIRILGQALNHGRDTVRAELAQNQAAVLNRGRSSRVHVPSVQQALERVTPQWGRRRSDFPARCSLQREKLDLPLFPTTTIGSFPQTTEIRRTRRLYRQGRIDHTEYRHAMHAEIERCIREQEALGLDVLVHGEAERNDMVEYFGEQLEGFAFTRFGWVQSYGSRCVKPPIIYGDVVRPHALTVDWWRFAQDLTDRPVKGMLTGPITMLGWSFVRDDQPLEATARQLALALRDEVLDLESAGARVIQIDEPALRERLPLRQAGRAYYLNWAVEAFKLSASGVRDDTQIHTHMCYSEFNDIIEATAALDADVITIETSRSHGELLQAFEAFHYPNDIGPGVYDIHSPNVPEVSDMVDLLERAARDLPVERLWVNPDCGLKTRDWPETEEALHRMVKAARIMREKYGQRSIDRHVADQPGVTAGASTVA